jgi:hypothetical protein
MSTHQLRRALRVAALPVAIFAVAGLGSACSTSGGGGGGNPDLITREEIEAANDPHAYDLIRRVRPRWLRARTQGSFGNPEPMFANVYVNELRFGDLNSLQRLDIRSIERIEYVDALDATTRFGTGNVGGVINVVLRGRVPN